MRRAAFETVNTDHTYESYMDESEWYAKLYKQAVVQNKDTNTLQMLANLVDIWARKAEKLRK